MNGPRSEAVEYCMFDLYGADRDSIIRSTNLFLEHCSYVLSLGNVSRPSPLNEAMTGVV